MLRILVVFICVHLIGGCDRLDRERVYQEVVIKQPEVAPPFAMDPHAGMGMGSLDGMAGMGSDSSSLQWNVPSGWQEVAGSGMRVATFKRADDPDAIDVSIVTLSGPAGGLEANLTRWAGQINLDLSQNDGLSRLISSAETLKTQDGIEMRIFNFTRLQKDLDPLEKSTVAAMVEINGSTVFVKMTGTVKTVTDNLETFETLAQSVRAK